MVAISTADGATVNLLHLAGTQGPTVLFLHANGFHIRCYTPLAKILGQQRLQCWGVEFRGQGSLPAPAGNLSDHYVSDILSVLDALSLQGCFVFAHSGGASAAIRCEAQRPGLFAAIYAYEPVIVPNSFESSFVKSSQGFEQLAAGARRRRSNFKSKQDAAQRFRSRPPFSSWNQDCFQKYIQHGLTDQSDGTCTLAIATESEARWYIDAGKWALENGRHDYPKVQCPITVAVGGAASGPINYLAAGGVEQAPCFPKGRSESFDGFGHLGPLEDPCRVAHRALQTFLASRDTKSWAALPATETVPVTQANL